MSHDTWIPGQENLQDGDSINKRRLESMILTLLACGKFEGLPADSDYTRGWLNGYRSGTDAALEQIQLWAEDERAERERRS